MEESSPSISVSDIKKSSDNTSDSDSDSDAYFDTQSAQEDESDDLSSNESEDPENDESDHSSSNESDHSLSNKSDHSSSIESEDTEDENAHPDNKQTTAVDQMTNENKLTCETNGVCDARKMFEQENSDLKNDATVTSPALRKDAAQIFKNKAAFFIKNESKFEKNEESDLSTLSLPRWNSEKNFQDRQSAKESNDLSGRYVWQSSKKNDQNEKTSKSFSAFKEMEGNTGLNFSNEMNSKGKIFSWHGSLSTPALAKHNINSEKMSILSENKKLSEKKTFKTLENVPFEVVKTGFTWNVKNKNSKIQTDVHKEIQTSQKLSDPHKDNIMKLEEKLKKLSEENSSLKVQQKQLKVTLKISQLQAKILKPYFSLDQSECLVHYNAEEKEAVLIGPDNLVKEFESQLARELQEIKEEEIGISKELLSVLAGEKGKKYLNNLDVNGALIAMEGNSIKVVVRDESVLTEALHSLKTKLESKEILTCNFEIPDEKFISLKFRLEQEFLVSMNYEEKKIIIIGIPDDVIAASKSVETFLEEIGESEYTFSVGQPEAKFLFYLMEDKIDSILRSVEILERSITEHRIHIKFKGRKSEVKTVTLNLQDLRRNIKTTVWSLCEDFKDHELFLISKKFQPEKNNLMTLNYKDKYLFIFEIAGSINIVQADQTVGYLINTPSKTEQVLTSSSSTLLTYDVSSTCHLTIKSDGDITREDSDILVSLLGTDIDMKKTSVGQSFSKLCPNHWRAVKEYHDSNPHAKVIIVQKPEGLKCLAVCHIILSPWNHRSSRAQLADALGNILDEAKCLGAKSVSFPPLGCGRMFKFPPEVVAEVMMKSFKDNNIESFLQDVVVLAPDSTLFNEFKTNALKYFRIISKAASPVVPDRNENASKNKNMSVDCINIQSHRDILHSAKIIIYTQQDVDIGEVKIQKKKEIKDEILQTDTIKPEILKIWSKASWERILKEAIEHNVWIEKHQNPVTQNIEFHLTGRREMLVHLKSFIQIELQNLTSSLPKNRLSSPQAPRRGTVEFLKYASECDEHFPSYWSLNSNESYWEKIKQGKLIDKSEFNILVDVDHATKNAITNLFINTQHKAKIGHGADAKGLKYSQLKVVDVKRVENPELFEKYSRERELLLKKMVKLGRICENIGHLPNSHGEVATVQYLPDFMKKELCHEINEHYLFHGAKSDAITTLVNNGLDPRVSNKACMFGKGIYTAEKSTKADQYSDFKDKRVPNGTSLQIILTRMLLGNVFLCDGTHKSLASKDSTKLSRPPCMKCSEDICKCHDQLLYDSVIGNGHWIFREFVVYEGRYCYPEYIITYQRI